MTEPYKVMIIPHSSKVLGAITTATTVYEAEHIAYQHMRQETKRAGVTATFSVCIEGNDYKNLADWEFNPGNQWSTT